MGQPPVALPNPGADSCQFSSSASVALLRPWHGSWCCPMPCGRPKQSYHSFLLPWGILVVRFHSCLNWSKDERRKRHQQDLLCFLSKWHHEKSCADGSRGNWKGGVPSADWAGHNDLWVSVSLTWHSRDDTNKYFLIFFLIFFFLNCMWGAQIWLACPGLWKESKEFYQLFQWESRESIKN